jgi:acyl-CoA thioesterase I
VKGGIAFSMLPWTLLFLLPIGVGSSEAENPVSEPQSKLATTAAKVMPLGDSITESNKGLPSYRYYLWHLALSQGYRIDFVGSRNGVGNGPPASTGFDMDHEGHAGWRADQILAHMQAWAESTTPDFVLIHLGHNDLCQGQSVASTVNDISAIVDVLRTVNPRVVILLAQLTASASPCHSAIPLYNAQLPGLAAAKSSTDSPVIIVDQYTGFEPPTMTYDGTHLNAQGEAQMADRWFAQLAPLLDDFAAASSY